MATCEDTVAEVAIIIALIEAKPLRQVTRARMEDTPEALVLNLSSDRTKDSDIRKPSARP